MDHRPFKLCKDSHYPEQGLAGRRGRVDPLLMNEEVHFLRMNLRKEINQV